MSALKDNVSSDAAFLECHKLLESMEDTTSTKQNVSPKQETTPTPNGHLSPEKDCVDQESETSDSISATVQCKPVKQETLNTSDIRVAVASHNHVPKDTEKVASPATELDHCENVDTNGFVSESHEPPKLKPEPVDNQNCDNKDHGDSPKTLHHNGSTDPSTKSSKSEDQETEKAGNDDKPELGPPTLESIEPGCTDKKPGDSNGQTEKATLETCKTEKMEVDEGDKEAPPPLEPMKEVKEGIKTTSEVTQSDTMSSASPSTTTVTTVPQNNDLPATSSAAKPVTSSVQSVPPKPIAPKTTEVSTVQSQTKVPVTALPSASFQTVATTALSARPSISDLVEYKGKGRARKGGKQAVPPPPKIPKELGPTASFLCDLGMDLVKEGVYKDLISIQSKKQKADKLNESEIKQLEKLKENYDSVSQKNKEVKVNFNLKCERCKFVTESKNVMWLHNEYPHTDDRENLYCSHCSFATRIPVVFNFHMESEHQMRGRIIPKPTFWNCNLCQFETNSKGVLTKHRWKCEKGFNYKLNLCPTSSHVNYCLAYNFYKQPKPAPPPPPPPPPQPPKPVIRPPVPRVPVQSVVRVQSFVPRARTPTPIRRQVPQPPVRMIPVIRTSQQSVIVQRPMTQPQYQYVPRPSAPTTLTVKQMLNSQPALGQPQLQVQNYARPVIRAAAPPQPDLGLVSCEICKGFVKDKDALRVHFFFAHQIDLSASLLKGAQPPLYCDVCQDRFWTSQGLQKHKETMRHYKPVKTPNPTTQAGGMHICIICGIRVQLLINHMSSVHNLTLRDFLIAKRCIVCGGSFQNRPSLEIHLASSHGILVKTGVGSPNTAIPPAPRPPLTIRPALAATSANRIMPVSALRTTGASVCLICNISFLNNDLLTKHCQHCHASCVGCGMIFADVAARNLHRCSGKNTNLNQILACLVCKSRVHSRNMRTHVLKYHIKKCSVSLKRKREWDTLGEELVKKPRLPVQSEPKVLSEQEVNNSKHKDQTPASNKPEKPVISDCKASDSEPVNIDDKAEVKKNSAVEESKDESQNVSGDALLPSETKPNPEKSVVPFETKSSDETEQVIPDTSDNSEKTASTNSDKTTDEQPSKGAEQHVTPESVETDGKKEEPMEYEETLCKIQPLNG